MHQPVSGFARHATLMVGLTLLSGLAACSARQGYASAQAWQRNQCLKIVDTQERLKCMRDSDTPYDEYKKASEAVLQKP